MNTTETAAGNRDVVGEILHELNLAGAKVVDLLDVYHEKIYERYWQMHPELYQEFARKLVSAGHPTRAIDLVREGLKRHPHDLRLKHRLALAFARGGNVVQADRCLQELLEVPAMPPDLWVDVVSLQGRCYKDRYRLTQDQAARRDFARKSALAYQRAFEASGKLFPLINFTTMSLLAEEPLERGRELAGEVLRRAERQGPDSKSEPPYWLPATLAEAHVILGQAESALVRLREAIKLAGDNSGDINSIRTNLLLLRERALSEGDWDALLAECDLGKVMVFAGHMIDPPSNYRGRFPPEPALAFRVQEEIRKALSEHKVTVGYCSASCGADLLFAEAVLNRGGELHVVLPFRKEDFFKTSVDFGQREMRHWRAKCDTVLRGAKQVHYATTEPYLGDDILFDFMNTFLHGLALTRAAERGVVPEALVVVDPELPPEEHGIADFTTKWKGRTRRDPQIINLASLRRETNIRSAPERLGGPAAMGSGRRQIKAMLFADVKGFSRLPEENLPPFFDHFLGEVDKVLKATPGKSQPLFCNTWGDGLFMVFEDAVGAAGTALSLLREIKPEAWGIPAGGPDPKEAPMALRIGLHTGPVYEYHSPILNRKDFFGSHVNRAARIEPVTTPGCAFASEQFAATLAVRTGHDFVCEFVGIEDLAKDYDRCPLYHLLRR